MDNVDDIYPLTPSQAGILYHALREGDPALYFEQVRSDLTGCLDEERLTAVWAATFERHPALRTMFVWQGLDEPLQVVRSKVQVPWRTVDLRPVTAASQPAEIDRLCAEERTLGFDLSSSPISRMLLIRLAEDRWHFVWNFHHILLDGWSTVAVFEETFDQYASLDGAAQTDSSENRASENRDSENRASQTGVSVSPPRPFRDHVAWLKAQDTEAAEKHWRSMLAGFDTPTPIRFGRVDSRAAFELGSVDISIGEEPTAEIVSFARSHRVTLNTMVQAAWGTVLARYGGADDVVFGVTMSGRPAELDGVEDMIGMFLNTLPMRIDTAVDRPIGQWIADIQAQQLDLITYQYSSLAEVHRWSDLRPGDALFDSILVFENYPRGELTQPTGLTVERRAVFEQSHYALTVMVKPGTELGFTVLYDHSRFDESAVTAMFGHLGNALTDMVRRPESTPVQLDVLSADERQRMLVEWNDTSVPGGLDTTLTAMFAEQAAATPDATALVYDDETMSYSELDVRSSRLAHRLVALGVGPEVGVGVVTYRSFDMVVGVLAALKAGGAYVPLDPKYPADRVALIAADASLGVILTHPRAEDRVPDCGAIVIDASLDLAGAHPDDAPVVEVDPDATALITFTSGSTGRPKGVQAHHRGIINRIRWQWRTYPTGDDEVFCQKTTLNFVDHLSELWGPLLAGRPQVLVPEDIVLDSARFLDLLAAHGVRRIVLVPSYMHALLDSHDDLAKRVPDLEYWTLSGEAVSRALAARFRHALPDACLLNTYGMSEATVDLTYYDDRWGIDCDTLPIGRPIDNLSAFVLDDHLRPVPVGVVGQIHTSGVGLSRGYWGRDDLTAERFLEHPFSDTEAERLYATGDLGRWLPSGHIEYMGRADNQVKIRGVRIELGEVEAVLRGHDAVSDAVVVTRDDHGEDRLVAYVVGSGDRPIDLADLRAFSEEQLTSQMIPSAIVVLDEFPKTPNGKIDKRALPAPVIESTTTVVDESVLSEDEARMLALWREVLGPWVGVDDDFFDVGGHSLLALRLVGRVAKDFGHEIPLATFFASSTPRTLAAHLAAPSDAATESKHLVTISEGRSDRPPIYCVHGAGGNVLNLQSLGANLGGEWSLVGIQAAGVDGVAEPHRSIDEYCDAYLADIVAHQPEGPYLFAGYSAGGVIAYEMARRLHDAGETVLAVGLLDTINPNVKRARLPTARRALTIAAGGLPKLKARLLERRRRLRRAAEWRGRIDTVADDGEADDATVPLHLRGERLTRNMAQIISAHETPPYPGKVVMFGAEHIDWAYERGGPSRGWNRVASNLDIWAVPGRHTDIVQADNAAHLATAMAESFGALLAEHVSRRGDSAAA